MALTPDEIGKLTLEDVEAIAQRFSRAVATIREAQALLGGQQTPAIVAPVLAGPVFAGNPAPHAPPSRVTPEQQKALDDWRHSPARQKLLEQFKDEQPEVEQ